MVSVSTLYKKVHGVDRYSLSLDMDLYDREDFFRLCSEEQLWDKEVERLELIVVDNKIICVLTF